MLKPVKSKAQERRELDQQVRDFLAQGGKVEVVDRGISGRDIGAYPLPPVAFDGEKNTRTPVTDEVKAIEARRVARHSPPSRIPTNKRPRKILITDDFGEPLRWQWQED